MAVFMVVPFITFRAQLKCHLLLPNHTICTLFFSCMGLIPDLIILSLLYLPDQIASTQGRVESVLGLCAVSTAPGIVLGT